ncbi:hypothetical protein TUM20985_06840 [Mycobacterium antarcticum]|uniref:hypothetical protein n=1 Tax=unclassified Mycolicibacterium TaxID=2636767 RepID=UPI0023870DD4|nr:MULTISPECIES: hypothetical protein [unclassified Mycolicibacterium]BDX30137.1 hypothetical protein TUM20985_06840 [Mycolicibacterium sp. TUM20985]GLP79273.1 hypothetical protein TUM20984_06930 [Mycolicibacterium sp. TUM20984]
MSVVVSSETAFTDDERRQRLYGGEVFCIPPRDTVRAFTDFAYAMIVAAFGSHDPLTAHRVLPVADYVDILKTLKPAFTHHPRAKELLLEILVDLGADPTKTYFDVPKLRVVPPTDYLSAGLGYNYKPHRDTWYSAPQCQNNWWTPIAGNSATTGMQFHPDFWQQPVPNTSDGFDAYEWNRTSRRDAAVYVKDDPRPHPKLATGDPGTTLRVVGDPGSLLSFSGAQLHSTVPNQTDAARLSVDFRTAHIDDLVAQAGPANIDSRSTGTSVRDYLRADTQEALPEEVIALYDLNGSTDGVLVFEPSVLAR